MISEQIESFIDELLRKTERNELDWRPIVALKEWNSRVWMDEYIRQGFSKDSIHISKSFFLQSGEGYVFLIDILRGNTAETSATEDIVTLMVKINDVLPVDDLSEYVIFEQDKLRSLQIVIEKYFKQKFTYPDVLYRFFDQVVSTDEVKREKD